MDTPPPSPLDALVHSLSQGALDRQSWRLPQLSGRTFWLGAALGAGLVLALRARSHSHNDPGGEDKAPL